MQTEAKILPVLKLPRDRWEDLSTEHKKSLLARYTVVLTQEYQDA